MKEKINCMKVLIVYHSSDFDGTCSKIIALRAFPGADVLGFNYGDQLPKNLGDYDQIVMIDISFPPDIMKEIKDRLLWIDHHVTAIQDSEKNGYAGVPGIRKIGEGACELAWKYLMKSSVPQAVKYLSAYDVFNKDRLDWNQDVIPFQYALTSRYGLDLPDEVLDMDPQDIVMEGRLILSFLKQEWKKSVENYGFPVTVGEEEKLKGICMITTQRGSLQFDSVFPDYDLFVFGTFDNSGVLRFSLASNENRAPEFNCGAYMKKYYNGGGHAGIGGGYMNEEQYTRLIRDKIL